MTDSGLQILARDSVVLDASGNGTIRFAPAGTTWTVKRVAVKCNTHVLESVCRVYNGPGVADAYYVVGTLSGSTGDTTTDDNIFLTDGSPMFVAWFGGDVGATANAIVWGYRDISDGGFNAIR